MKTDPRIDAYIDRQADFARPILRHLREMIHTACPEAEETLKWSMPSFLYRGKILAGMAAFKAHATFGYWNDSMLNQDEKNRSAMGQFGRLTSLDDLPPKATLVALTRQSMALVDTGAKPPRATAKKAPFTPRTCARRSTPSPPPPRPSTPSPPAANANMSNGSPRPSATRPAPSASRKPSNGSRKGSAATGNTRIAEAGDPVFTARSSNSGSPPRCRWN